MQFPSTPEKVVHWVREKGSARDSEMVELVIETSWVSVLRLVLLKIIKKRKG